MRSIYTLEYYLTMKVKFLHLLQYKPKEYYMKDKVVHTCLYVEVKN